MKKIVCLSMFIILVSTLFFWSSGEVRAEAAKCFKKDGSTITLEQCDDFFATAAAFFFGRSPVRGASLLDDKCYMARNGILVEKPVDGPECTRWQAEAVDNTAANQAPPITSGSAAATGRFECTGTACVEDNPITKFLFTVINFLSALIGIIVIAVIIMAGIQYTTSGGNPQQAAQAKKRIINAITALVALFFLFAILQWLIPGGIFKS